MMHREIISASIGPIPVGMLGDHKNLDGLDNRRDNLRIATRAENKANSRKYKRSYESTSTYKGVYRQQAGKKWCALIAKDGKNYHLGTFANEIDAARAYNMAARKLYGEFSLINREI